MTNKSYPKEIIYRKKLAKNLEILEQGLSLIKEEYPLNNPIGTKGYIDILAKDIYSNIVIIEIKRSQTASRQAIHELSKYIALIKHNEGIPQYHIRCIVISTHWEELRFPFFEFSQETNYQLTGYQLNSDSMGDNISLSEIHPLQIKNHTSIEFYRGHLIFLYRDKAYRDKMKSLFLDKLKISRFEGGVVFDLEFLGDNKVIYPYAHYLAVISLSKLFKKEWLKKNNNYIDETWIEDELLGKIDYLFDDDRETANPDTLASLVANQWKLTETEKFGLISNLITNRELFLNVSGMSTGENTSVYFKTISPKHNHLWIKSKEEVKNVLYGNKEWECLITQLFELIEKKYRNSIVSINIYNPLNILYSMYLFILGKRPKISPFLEILISSDESDKLIFLNSMLVSDLMNRENNINFIIENTYIENQVYIEDLVSRETWKKDDDIVKLLDFHYEHIFYEIDKEGSFFSNEIDIKNLNSLDENSIGIESYITHNKVLQNNVVNFFESMNFVQR